MAQLIDACKPPMPMASQPPALGNPEAREAAAKPKPSCTDSGHLNETEKKELNGVTMTVMTV